MKTCDIVQNRNRAKDIDFSENKRTARSGSFSMAGLEAEHLNIIEVKTIAMQHFDLCVVAFTMPDRPRPGSFVAHSSPTENMHV